eukprot:TRINITY_DN10206_c0_g1_i1.p1 TRINITY_DN10206_c0_g1~~TRINITY_DN10206_c0_g1_i1.p1  ORF type:complete len:1099 (+),score=207.08 TRINITY_DN10206_c0_g1_i1:243-3539(+)
MAAVATSGKTSLLVDGDAAISHAAYQLSDVCFVYGLGGDASTDFGHRATVTAESSTPTPNAFGTVPLVKPTEVRVGAGNVVRGALAGKPANGVSVIAPSQALVPMMPAIYRISRDAQNNKYTHSPATPSVAFHIAAQGLTHELSVKADHRDAMAVRDSGVAMLVSGSVREMHDIGTVAQIAATKLGIPTVHMFDGWDSASRRLTNDVQLASPSRLNALLAKAASINTTQHDSSQPNVEGEQLSQLLKQSDYKPVEYIGPANAETVIVVLAGAASAVLQSELANFKTSSPVGIVKVRLYRPWSVDRLIDALPLSVRTLAVIDFVGGDAASSFSSLSPLFLDVTASLRIAAASGNRSLSKINAVSGRVGAVSTFDPTLARALLQKAVTGADFSVSPSNAEASSGQQQPVAKRNPALTNTRQYVIWDAASDVETVRTTKTVSETLATVAQVSAHTIYDAFGAPDVVPNSTQSVCQPGVFKSTLRFTTSPSKGLGVSAVDVPYDIERGTADVVACHNTGILATGFDVLADLKKGGAVLLNTPWNTVELLQEKLSPAIRKQLASQVGTALYTIHATVVAEALSVSVTTVLEAALIALASRITANLEHLKLVDAAVINGVLGELKLVPNIPAEWATIELDEATTPTPKLLQSNLALSSGLDSTEHVKRIGKRKRNLEREVAWAMMFPSAYNTAGRLPACEDIEDRSAIDAKKRTHHLTVLENKRLTPYDYERNVFHLDLSLKGTDLQYDIGDALGISAHNPPEDVEAFLQFYGAHPESVLSFDVAVAKDTTGGVVRKELETVRKAFTRRVDIFGRPAKNFYESLIPHAKDAQQKEKLELLVSPGGGEDYKRRVAEATTFADVLREFDSVHPEIEELVNMIPRIKMRVYSVASSQKLHPTNIQLLIVTHDWTTPSGAIKRGQCTRYLETVRPGDIITCALKPSVMKLPASPESPVIMAGLGTGLAPFRAFIEERCWQREQGAKVGPMALYFGSRSRFAEYLYGEELDAYNHQSDKLLTYLRLAFSRDQAEKIYIQHRIEQDAELLHDLLLEKQGTFYLCGPTWPVADIRKALLDGFQEHGGLDLHQSEERLEALKESGQYILEVY